MTESTVGRIEQLRKTLVARRHIRRHQRHGACLLHAGDDLERGNIRGRAGVADGEHADRNIVDRLDHSERRGVGAQTLGEDLDHVASTLDFDEHLGGVVPDEAAEPEFGRQSVDERPETDTLYDAANVESTTLDSASGWRCAETVRCQAGTHQPTSQIITRLLPESATAIRFRWRWIP